jgi:hypothetical protein
MLILVCLFLLKFIISVRVGVIKNRFGRYLVSNVALSISAPLAVWVAVDFLGLPASISTAIILGLVFLLRYALMGKLGILLIKSDNENG